MWFGAACARWPRCGWVSGRWRSFLCRRGRTLLLWLGGLFRRRRFVFRVGGWCLCRRGLLGGLLCATGLCRNYILGRDCRLRFGSEDRLSGNSLLLFRCAGIVPRFVLRLARRAE